MTRRVLVVGAGEAARIVVREIREHPALDREIVGLLDDDPALHGTAIDGIEVLGPSVDVGRFAAEYSVREIIIAVPSASGPQVRELLRRARQTRLPVRIVPGIRDIIKGTVRWNQVREVIPEDLLGRETVDLTEAPIRDAVEGKRILVTGAGGSIGSEICRQVLRFGVEELLALDIDETGLFNLNRGLARRFDEHRVRVIIGDVRDRARMRDVFSAYHPQVIFHAAAYKHVPLMEEFPAEAVKTNIFGTRTVLEEARRQSAEAFVFISTDKAVNPTSVMGATKRVAETIVRSPDNGSSTRCMAVRFGNVLGSRGSVIPTFVDQIHRGGPVTVTHPDMKRYFMLTSEAVLLVLQAGAMGRGGEVFVLDMGKPVLILDLARDLIRFYGYEPDQDIAIVYTGVRPGEKLYEELLTAEEGTEATTHEKIFVANMNAGLSSMELSRFLEDLERLIDQKDDGDKIREVLKETVFSSTSKHQRGAN